MADQVSIEEALVAVAALFLGVCAWMLVHKFLVKPWSQAMTKGLSEPEASPQRSEDSKVSPGGSQARHGDEDCSRPKADPQ